MNLLPKSHRAGSVCPQARNKSVLCLQANSYCEESSEHPLGLSWRIKAHLLATRTELVQVPGTQAHKHQRANPLLAVFPRDLPTRRPVSDFTSPPRPRPLKPQKTTVSKGG